MSGLPGDAGATAQNYSYIDVGDGSATLSWDYRNTGDYNQDSEVSISDITQIVLNYGTSAGDTNWGTAAAADGDGNLEINISDITPIVLYYATSVTGYKIEHSTLQSGPWAEIDNVATTDSLVDPLRRFEYNIPAPISGDWYRVRAFSSEDPSQGPATDALQVNLLPPGDNPVAVADSGATSGEPPLTVNFFGDASYDDDGTIEAWWWDLEGDGTFETDATITMGAVTHIYESVGTYNATLRVIDNDGRSGTAVIVISVGMPDPGDPPEAFAYCMPNFGWAPLEVFFSPFMSSDPDDTITAYEWDMDGNGSYEVSATSTDGYTSHTFNTAGEYTVGLRLTDGNSNYGFASVSITVLDPAASSVDYWGIYDNTTVERIDIEITQENWDAMWAIPDAEVEVRANAVIFGDDLPDIGIRMKGNSSLNGPGQKKPWKIDTNEFVVGQEFRNMKMVILNNGFKDASMAREVMAYEMLRFAGAPASHSTHAEVWFTIGTELPEFWGVYTMVERVDKKFIENRFIDDTGNLYKAKMPADLTWYGTEISSYPKTNENEICYDKQTNSTAADYSDIINLIDIVDNQVYPTDADFTAALEAVFNVDGFLRYQAVTKLHSNADVYSYMSQNYYLYNNPVTGKFEWIAWDLNEAWGQFGPVVENENNPLYQRGNFGGPGPGREAPLFDKVFGIPKYRQTYAAYLDLLLRNNFTYAKISESAMAYRDLIDGYVIQDEGDKMEYSYIDFAHNWDEQIPGIGVFRCFGIGEFTQTRVDYANAHLLVDL